jgi:hypothetical protein
MPFDNLISLLLTPAELTQFDDLITSMETLLAGKLLQLTAKESQLYGKIGNENENWTKMLHDDAPTGPAGTIPVFVDEKEWDKDVTVRGQLSPRVTRLENLAQQLTDTNRVVGYDIYQTSLTVYNNVKYLSTQNVPGAKALYEKWSIQFPGKNGKKPKQ